MTSIKIDELQINPRIAIAAKRGKKASVCVTVCLCVCHCVYVTKAQCASQCVC